MGEETRVAMAVNHPTFGTFCEICFTRITEQSCAVDTDGTKWDVCKGECARQAGVVETTSVGSDAAATRIAELRARPVRFKDSRSR